MSRRVKNVTEERTRTVTIRRPLPVDSHTRKNEPHTNNALQEKRRERHHVYTEMMVRDVHYDVEEECCERDTTSEAEVGEYPEYGAGEFKSRN